MAQVKVDSSVLRDKANVLDTASSTIQTLYSEMLQEVTATASKMKGTVIETQREKFAAMQTAFETISKDVKSYSTFLIQAAEAYEETQRKGQTDADQIKSVF